MFPQNIYLGQIQKWKTFKPFWEILLQFAKRHFLDYYFKMLDYYDKLGYYDFLKIFILGLDNV